MYYVYILKSGKDNKLYIGCTNSINRRLQEHNSGLSKATANRRPFELVYCEVFKALHDALRRESNLKKFKKTYTELKKRITDSLQ